MKRKLLELCFDGGLIVIKGTDRCLGDLMYFGDEGCWCPDNGKVPVTREEATTHNRALDQARLEGLDQHCEIGQAGMAYIDRLNQKVRFFSGTVVAENVSIGLMRRAGAAGYYNIIQFDRAGKHYKGRVYNDGDLFSFERIS